MTFPCGESRNPNAVFTLTFMRPAEGALRAMYEMDRNEQELAGAGQRLAEEAEACGGDLLALNADVFELFYKLTSAPQHFPSEADVCQAFSTELLRHWHLCSINTFLCDETGQLHECAIHSDHHTTGRQATEAAAFLARHIKRTNRECGVWLTDEALTEQRETADAPEELRAMFTQAGMKAAFGVPIHARENLIGVLVAATNSPQDLRDACQGIRFIAVPIVIAISNARRAAAVRAQREHIARLDDELHQHVAALEEANRELQRVARYRSLFLARMSHELRTPLTSILGFAEILLDHEDLSEPQRRFCQKIQSSGLQQQESLNALVDLSRLEAGQSELFLHEFSLREMLRESCVAVNRLARKAEVNLERAISVDLGTIVSDEGKLRQVLYNFLAFAIQRTPPGGRVLVEAGALDDAAAESARRFCIEITDEGEPLLDPSHIFEPLDEGHAPGGMPNDRGTDMNELGLVIAHRLIGILNGEVELHNTEPRGLRVRLTFPQLPTQGSDE